MTTLIIGGTGTLGEAILPKMFGRVRVMSRGEHKQMEMQRRYPDVDFLVGDVRDYDRVEWAVRGCSNVFHFAAFKSVDKAEYDPEEAVKTNIGGTINVTKACIKGGVDKAVFTSSDKAVMPFNLYGSTKLVAEKLFIQGNVGKHITRFACVRYGNVLASNGSVIQLWREQLEKGEPPTLTDPDMTRFFMKPEEAAGLVLKALSEMTGGETFIPPMKSTTMLNLVTAWSEINGLKNKAFFKPIGTRPGEKIHEVLISNDEAPLVTRCGDCFIRWPSHRLFPLRLRGEGGVAPFTSYDAERFTTEELKEMLC